MVVSSTTTVVPFGETAGFPSGVTVATNATVLRSINCRISSVIMTCSRPYADPG